MFATHCHLLCANMVLRKFIILGSDRPLWRHVFYGVSFLVEIIGVDNVKEWAKPFYKSKAWRDCREAFFISKHGLCERCGRPGLIVHHRIYLTPQNINDPNITLSFENLELLCSSCHNNEHHSTDVTADGLCFNEHGELVVDNPK